MISNALRQYAEALSTYPSNKAVVTIDGIHIDWRPFRKLEIQNKWHLYTKEIDCSQRTSTSFRGKTNQPISMKSKKVKVHVAFNTFMSSRGMFIVMYIHTYIYI